MKDFPVYMRSMLLRLFMITAWTLLAGVTAASGGPMISTQVTETRSADRVDTSPFDGRIIDSVIIDNRDVYNTDSARYDKFIFKLANSLHLRTREFVIRRELLLQQGDRYNHVLAEETARNIRTRLAVFNAWVETTLLDNGHVRMQVVTIDQWSLEAGVDVRKVGPDNSLKFSVKDRNLLGLNQLLAVDYTVQSNDESYLNLSFREKRLFGQPLWFETAYGTDPQNEFVAALLQHPYYTRSQRFAYGIEMADRSGRRDIYRDNRLVAQSQFEGDDYNLFGSYRVGSYYEKLTYQLSARYVYQAGTDNQILSTNPIDSAEANSRFAGDSLYYELRGGISFSHNNFVKLRRIDGFDVTEDFTTGRGLALSFGRAFNDGGGVYNRGRASYGHVKYDNGHLFAMGGEGSLWWLDGHRLRESLRLRGYYYNRTMDDLTIAGRLAYDADSRRDGSNPLVLGGTTGVRGLDEFAATGNRRIVFNLEARSQPQLEILSVLFGGAAFFDVGRTFEFEEEFGVRNMVASIGAGLRISLERASSEGIVRIDVAYSETAGWGLSISTGQYFIAPRSVFP